MEVTGVAAHWDSSQKSRFLQGTQAEETWQHSEAPGRVFVLLCRWAFALGQPGMSFGKQGEGGSPF